MADDGCVDKDEGRFGDELAEGRQGQRHDPAVDIFADDGQQWALSKGVIVLVGITLAIVAAGIISILIL